MYDIFYVSKNQGNDLDWKKIKSKYPLAQRLSNVTTYNEIKSKAFTKMFWVIWDDLDLDDSFNLLDYKTTQWDDMYIHVFKNGEYYDGVCLFPKNKIVSQREFHHRFFTDKKEIDIRVSFPKQYNRYILKTYEEYKNITDEMFWIIWPEIKIINDSTFDLYFSHHNSYDRRENHVFKNLCNGTESYQSGVVLCSKYKPLSKKEFEKQYIIDKKEHDVIVSKYFYPVYKINSYEEYLKILETENQKMFWVQWPEIEIIDESVFDFYFDYYNEYDINENHVFKNLCNDTSSYLNGLILFSRSKIISKKEFNRRYLIDKKEHNIEASRFRYKRYNISSYQEYLEILKTETQPLFWAIWPEIEIIDESVFDFYFDPNDGKYDHDRRENHIFKHQFNDQEIFVNGPILFSKEKIISQKEFNHRFLIEKKEHDRLVSKHRPYDVVFISYNEPNADQNYSNLLKICPRAKRVHGVKGIHQAHIEAAKLCTTDMVWVVDGDAIIENNFNFNLSISSYDIDCVHVWCSRNSINNLEYGNGGVKLLPRLLTLSMNTNTTDMTTSISKKFKSVEEISNINQFNTDEFSTWRSAFRECCKLASRVIERQYEKETQQRLDIWCSVGSDKPFGKYAIAGAQLGRAYGEKNKTNLNKLKKINDFDWLYMTYKKQLKN